MMVRVTAAILIKNERILIARRKDTDELAGKWEFPGGKIEENEAPEACLIREMKEEFGIEVAIKDFFGENIHCYEKESIRLLAYHTVWVGGDFSLNAHAAIKWVSLSQLHEFDFAPADQPLVVKLQKNPL